MTQLRQELLDGIENSTAADKMLADTAVLAYRNVLRIADAEEEGRRMVEVMQGHSVLVMANHGVTVTGETVADAVEDLYFFEKAAQTLIHAMSPGRPLSVLTDEVARATAEGWAAYRGMAARHFDSLKASLDTEDASWRE